MTAGGVTSATSALGRFDEWLAGTSRRWRWIGHLAVVWIGVHFAADRVDDAVASALGILPWPAPDLPLVLGTWSAIALELYVDGWAAFTWARSGGPAIDSFAAWRARVTPAAVAAPALWLTAGIAGVWVTGMAVEDLLPDGALSRGAAAVVDAALVWRLVWPALSRVGARPAPAAPLPPAALAAALAPVALVAALAVRHGWPIWGLLP